MADQTVEEPVDVGLELGRLRVELRQRLGQAVADLDLATAPRAQQLVLVVAADAQRVSGRDHAHHQAKDAGSVGSAVDQVTDEDGGTPVRRYGIDGSAVVRR